MKTVQWVSSRECPLWVDTKEGVGLCNHPDKATEDPPFCGADYCQQCKLRAWRKVSVAISGGSDGSLAT